MAQDKPLCRFCLESSHRASNPLLDPCQCKGSMQFVHKVCLNRWRLIDIARNGTVCSLCRTPYIFISKQSLESIPYEHCWMSFSLRYPYLPYIAVHYCWVFHQALLQNGNGVMKMTLFPYYQILFHIVYACMFLWNAQIKHKSLYKKAWQTQRVFIHVPLHGILFYFAFQDQPILSLAFVYFCGFYWRQHVRILEDINKKLLE